MRPNGLNPKSNGITLVIISPTTKTIFLLLKNNGMIAILTAKYLSNSDPCCFKEIFTETFFFAFCALNNITGTAIININIINIELIRLALLK